MPIPFNQPGRNVQRHRPIIAQAVEQTLASGYYILGPAVEAFEQAFAAFCQSAHCIGVASGTDALVLALRALDLGPQAEVITAANAGGYASGACFRVGATPVYADVDPLTLLLDPVQAEAAISAATRAIIITHLYGNMADMTAFRALAERYQLALIEDCSQAHGASRADRPAGSWGDIGIFSFYPTKNLAALGDGGALVCQDSALAATLRELRQYGWQEKYTVQRPFGINSRLDALQAAILSAKLPYLEADNTRRRELAERYQAALADTPASLVRQTGPAYVAHLAVLRYAQRDRLRSALQAAGIGTDIHYPVLDCDQPGWQDLPWRALPLPVSRQACAQVLSLPLYPELRDTEITQICEVLQHTLTV